MSKTAIFLIVAALGMGYLLGNVFNVSSFTGQAVKTGDTQEQQPSQPTRVQVSVDDDPSLGGKDAKVYVIVFSDFQCPYCAAAEGYNDALISGFKQQNPSWEPPIPNIIENYVNTEKVRLVFRDFPLSFHQYAQKSAEAAECADEQGKFWEYHDELFENQDIWSEIGVSEFKKYASELGLDTTQFNSCLDNNEMKVEVQKDLQDGINAGVDGTPTFFVGNPKDGYIAVAGAQPFSVFKQIIDSMLG